MTDLAKSVFKINPAFLQLLIINYDHYIKSVYKFDYRDLNLSIMAFLSNELDLLYSAIKDNPDSLQNAVYFFDELNTEERKYELLESLPNDHDLVDTPFS